MSPSCARSWASPDRRERHEGTSMELHESLAQLARDHGESLFAEADAFRGALDDYLDEGSASTGTINLLTDAVRLGALQGMVTMLDSGASVEDAVETAGQRLSRDRGSADVAGSQWACAVLGYALGKVPVSLATGLRPTPTPPSPRPARPAAALPVVRRASRRSRRATHRTADRCRTARAAVAGASVLPPASRRTGRRRRRHRRRSSPVGRAVRRAPASPYAYTASPGYGTPPPKKSSSTGLIIGAIGGDRGARRGRDHQHHRAVRRRRRPPRPPTTRARRADTTTGGGETTQHRGLDRPGADPAGRRLHLPVPERRLEGPDGRHPRHHGDDRHHRRTGQLDQPPRAATSWSRRPPPSARPTSTSSRRTGRRRSPGSTGATPVDLGRHADRRQGRRRRRAQVDQRQRLRRPPDRLPGDLRRRAVLHHRAASAQGDSGFKDTYYAVLGTWVWAE